MGAWVVVLEMVRPAGAEDVASQRVEEVLRALAEAQPAALVGPDRCGLQLGDLDRFSAVNARLGREEGDRVLVTVARRLRGAVRAGDIVARLSADQFVVLLRNSLLATAATVAERVVKAVRLALPLDGMALAPVATVGVATARAGQTATELLQEAAAAVKTAKRLGGDQTLRFSAATLVPSVAALSLNPMLPPPETSAYVAVLAEVARITRPSRSLADIAAAVLKQVCTQTGLGIGRLWTRSH